MLGFKAEWSTTDWATGTRFRMRLVTFFFLEFIQIKPGWSPKKLKVDGFSSMDVVGGLRILGCRICGHIVSLAERTIPEAWDGNLNVFLTLYAPYCM